MYNLHSILNFGKYKSISIWAIAVYNPTYLDWCIKNIKGFCIENLEFLETLPRVISDNPVIAEQIKERVKTHPEIYQSKSLEPQFFDKLLAEKCYDSYLENFKQFMHITHKFKNETIELNNERLFKQKAKQLRDDSHYDSGDSDERYTFDDTINDAFEGDYSNYWNVD